MCLNHASEMRLLRSALVSCDGAVRVPSSLIKMRWCRNPPA